MEFIFTKIPKNVSQVLLLGPVLFGMDDSDLDEDIESMLIMSALEDDFGELKNCRDKEHRVL